MTVPRDFPTDRRRRALKALAERPGTEHEGILARKLLQDLPKELPRSGGSEKLNRYQLLKQCAELKIGDRVVLPPLTGESVTTASRRINSRLRGQKETRCSKFSVKIIWGHNVAVVKVGDWPTIEDIARKQADVLTAKEKQSAASKRGWATRMAAMTPEQLNEMKVQFRMRVIAKRLSP